MRRAACIEILVCWIVWWYPFVFRAPHVQKRPSITVAGPSRIGLLLETVAFFLAAAFHVPYDAPIAPALAIAALIPGPVAIAMGWTAVTHLGRQFRVHAGLYEDHQLVRTGPYAVVRHPIYSSMLAMLVAMVLVMTKPVWIPIALVLYIAGTEIRVRTEDGLLASRFPQQFSEYRKRVWAYIPFVR
jgi:protein-S-isoprenylcysteine O-methyltransferase Ste14